MTGHRIVGDRSTDTPMYIPLSDSSRARHILLRFLNGPTPEEQEQNRLRAEARAREEAAAYQHLLERHVELVATETHPAVSALLADHAPQQGWCRGCPSEVNEHGDEWLREAPCPVWKMIEANA
ncbi:hypothetical protein N8J89_07790 [Crossiella sp. CA-258035]|uniref:hypothetical protein n=1 Tax=Crossiella sp. CA-258035 TaxID=2981138 RepID=UPI0024BCD4BE|nr:hypothetical protein [Crossiella sp. CA-258035]WHT20955.1 hypothetical protein N8J89_07790 [Crossiella sp. CA-258035]